VIVTRTYLPAAGAPPLDAKPPAARIPFRFAFGLRLALEPASLVVSGRITQLAWLVRDYGRGNLVLQPGASGFALLEDTPHDRRQASPGCASAPPARGTAQRSFSPARRRRSRERAVGDQAGGRRYSLFLETDELCARTGPGMLAAGVRFAEEPRHEAYGNGCPWFPTCTGNKWDLVGTEANVPEDARSSSWGTATR
jgi:hypothetical protein